MEIKTIIFEDLIKTTTFLVLYLALFLLAKWLKDFLTPYKINDELTKKDNLSIALTMSGYYFGVVAIFVGALSGPSYGFTKDLLLVGGYSILGLILLNISRYFNDKVVLRKFCNIEQLVEQKNTAVGVVQLGTYVATGLVAAGSVTGTGGSAITAIVFFIFGQISLLIFTLIYDLLTPYCIHEELEKKNVAVGIALGGTLVALGIIIFNGVSGNFIGWKENLADFVLVNIMAFIFLPIIRLVMDKMVIPGDDLSREIIEDKNIGAGLLEATVAISFAIVLKVLL